jgi:hypothetical protein
MSRFSISLTRKSNYIFLSIKAKNSPHFDGLLVLPLLPQDSRSDVALMEE